MESSLAAAVHTLKRFFAASQLPPDRFGHGLSRTVIDGRPKSTSHHDNTSPLHSRAERMYDIPLIVADDRLEPDFNPACAEHVGDDKRIAIGSASD
jgi:hypothetical protein